jgi:hypothetical protein
VSSSYDFWLTDDYGRKIAQLNKDAYASYSRTVQGYGAIQLGLPYEYHKSNVPDVFKPDWRIDVWRSPDDNYPSRREGSFLLRKFNIYERVDGMKMIEFFGRSPIDLLRRVCICAGDDNPTAFEKTGAADDVMKEIVTENIDGVVPGFVLPSDEFFIDPDVSLGPNVDITAQAFEVLDILKDIRDITITLNLIAPTLYRKIYFDVEEGNTLSNGGFGYIFKTYADLRGQNRTAGGLIFSPPNGNLRKASYYEDYLDQVTKASVGYEAGSDCDYAISDERYLSRWNTIAKCLNSDSTDLDIQRRAYTELAKGMAKKVFNGDFLNTPGGPNQPRSLYGVDWDMGDLLRVEFADRFLDAEVVIVHVSVDEDGRENIVGQTEVGI